MWKTDSPCSLQHVSARPRDRFRLSAAQDAEKPTNRTPWCFRFEALKRQRRRQVEKRLLLGPHYKDPALVFASVVGTPIFSANLRRAFEHLLKAAGCPR